MGFFGGDTKVETKIPDYLKRFSKDTLKSADVASSRPYEVYPGQKIAQFSPDTLQGFDQARQAQGAWTPHFDIAGQTAGQVAGYDPATDIQPYLDPYLSEVVNRFISENQRAQAIDQNNLRGALAADSAYGTDQGGIMQAEMARNNETLRNNQVAQLLSQGFQGAVDNSMAGGALRLQGAGQLADIGQRGQGLAYADAAAMMDIGEQQRALSQTMLDEGYQEFLRQWNYPQEQVNFRTGVAGGQPYSTTGQQPGGDTFGQLLGAGAAGLGAYAAFASDIRLKRDVERIGTHPIGVGLYRFRFEGDDALYEGVMAHEVEQVMPEAVGEDGGYKTVDYAMIGGW